MSTIRLVLTILTLSIYLNGVCQNQATLRAYFDDADYDLSQEDYSNALVKLLKIYNVDSTNANVNYFIGVCYLNSVDNKKKALKFLLKSSSHVSPNYQSETFNEKNAPYDVYNQLGDAFAYSYKFDLAIGSYNRFYKTIKKNDHALKEAIERKIRSCEFGKLIIANPMMVEKKNLTSINSIMSDFNPILTPDQKLLFFTAEQGTSKPEDEKLIFKSINKKGKWEVPVNYTRKLSQEGIMITSFLSRDGKSMLLIEDEENRNSIYETKLQQNIWVTPKKLPKKINSGNIQPDAFLTKDGKTMYFSSNKKGGFGGLDIYKSVKKIGEWEEPVNLGPIINTPFDDINPKILDDNSLLFFSSKGHSSMGGFDVFYSKLNADGSWGEPENMGYPFNTPDNETDYWPVKDGFSGYMSRYEESGVGEKDIYFMTVTPAKENLTATNLSSKIISKDTSNLSQIINSNNNNNTDTNIRNIANSNDTSSLMTILIKATRNPLESAYLREIEGVRAYRGQDSVIRYYYGQYRSFEEASKDFDKILKIGFYSAQLKNLKEDTLYYYATSDLFFGQDSSDIVADYTENIIINDSTDFTDIKEATEKKGSNNNKQNEALKKDSLEEKEKQKEIEKKQIIETEVTVNYSAKLLNEITDKLVKATGDIFTIQISTLPKAGNIEYFKNIPYTTEHDCKDGKFRYSTGVFDNIEDARKYLEEMKTKGYPDAYVVNFNKARIRFYNDDITEHIQTYNLNYEGTQTTTPEVKEEEKLYSIQIASSIKPAEDVYFKGVTDVKEKLAKNGFYKYYYGKFSGYKNAKIELEKTRELGYKDAFIIKYAENGESKVITTNNEKEQTEEVEKDLQNAYTIQVASAKKQCEIKYFKGLDIIEIKGNNGFFVYIFGDFKTVASARKELTKVKNLGFKDAYINRSEKYK